MLFEKYFEYLCHLKQSPCWKVKTRAFAQNIKDTPTCIFQVEEHLTTTEALVLSTYTGTHTPGLIHTLLLFPSSYHLALIKEIL